MERIGGSETVAGRGRQYQAMPSAKERGQTLVVFAVMLVMLVAFLALVLDVGNIYLQRRDMQNAADAGALAGARVQALGGTTPAVDAAINQYATNNGAGSYSRSILASTVVVTASKTFPTYFASIVGVPTFSVWASATGGYSLPGSWNGGLMPTAVATATWALDQEVEIWDDQKTASNPPRIWADGQRGWLNFNGGSVSDSELVNWVTNGYPGEVEVGDWVNGDPGTRTSALHALDAVRKGTTVFVPLYDQTRPGTMGSGSLDYRIVGFAAFYVSNVIDTGTPKMVIGTFQRYLSAQEPGGTFDYGVRIIGLQH